MPATQEPDMALAPGFGVVPKAQRNAGYKKLEFEPGEGGIRPSDESGSDDGRMSAFLDGVAAGADPKELAARLAKAPTNTRRGR